MRRGMMSTRKQECEGEGGPAALALDAITAGYAKTPVLNSVCLQVPAASVVALLGPNGAGKTTLLKVSSGVLKPSAGTVMRDGQDVTFAAVDVRARHGLCDIPEGRGIFPSLTVKENLTLMVPRGRVSEAIDVSTDLFPQLRGHLGRVAGTLSGGEQQMLALSRAYVTSPNLVTIDEVSLGLAPRVIDELFEALRELVRRRVAILIVEQYVERALALADRVYLLNRGTIVFTGTTAEARAEDIFEHYMGTQTGRLTPSNHHSHLEGLYE
jgi:branched-chain amino acid transport system ATP-binding protein